MNAQTKRLLLLTTIVGVAFASVGAVADALVLTDEERLDELAADIQEAAPGLRIDAALRHVDTDRESVSVRLDGRRDRFDEGEEFDLARRLRNTLRDLEEPGVDFIQTATSCDPEGQHGHVSLRYRAQGQDARDITLYLRRHGDGWLIRRVQAR